MAGNADIIREYLVSLGFKIDQNSLNKFDKNLVKTAKSAIGLAATLTAVAVATTKFVDHFAAQMESLYWSSVRVKAGVANIQDFKLALSKVGGTAEGAAAALENVARFLRTSPVAEGLLHNLGVQTRDAEGSLRSTIDIVKDFANLPMPYWLKVSWAGKLGIDENTLQAIIRAAPEAQNKISELYKSLGMDADKAAKASMEFENQLRDLGAVVDIIGISFSQTLMPFAKGFVAIATTLAVWLVKLDGITDGWGTTLTYLGVIAGGIALAFGWIPAVIALFVLGAAAIIGNWDKVKGYFNSFFSWMQKKYNAFAKIFGLPQWTSNGPSGPVDPVKERGAPDWKQREKNLGPNSFYGGDGHSNDNFSKDQRVTGKALAFFQKVGWTANQAAGIVANLVHESGLNPNAVGDGGKARGIAQWHPDRQAEFAKWSGHDIKNSTLDEQLAFVNHELTRGAEKFAGKMLAGAQSASDAAMRVSKYYERPANQAGEMVKRGRTAATLMDGARVAPSGGNRGNVVINQKTDIKVEGSDAESTGRVVLRGQSRVNGDIVRNFTGAVQ